MGVLSFVFPSWATGEFPWKVGPFLATTIGGWCLGTAAIAVEAGRDARLPRILPLLAYLWLFGAGQLLVLVAFADKFQAQGLLTYPYLIGLFALLGSAAFGLADWWRRRPDLFGASIDDTPPPAWAPRLALAFTAFVGVLVAGTLIAGPNGIAAQRGFVPEAMTLFSLRAFAAFFLALAAMGIAVFPARAVDTYVVLARTGLYLSVPITIAALLNLGLFDLGSRPGGILYLGAYLVVDVGLSLALVWDQRRVQVTASVS